MHVDVCDQSQYKMAPKGIHANPRIVALIRRSGGEKKGNNETNDNNVAFMGGFRKLLWSCISTNKHW